MAAGAGIAKDRSAPHPPVMRGADRGAGRSFFISGTHGAREGGILSARGARLLAPKTRRPPRTGLLREGSGEPEGRASVKRPHAPYASYSKVASILACSTSSQPTEPVAMTRMEKMAADKRVADGSCSTIMSYPNRTRTNFL